jgi:hypothetical protein
MTRAILVNAIVIINGRRLYRYRPQAPRLPTPRAMRRRR